MEHPKTQNLDEDGIILKTIGHEGGPEIQLGLILSKQLVRIAAAADNDLLDSECRGRWKATVFTFEDLLTNEWTEEFKAKTKILRDGKIDAPTDEITKTRRIFQECMILAKPYLPKKRAIAETEE